MPKKKIPLIHEASKKRLVALCGLEMPTVSDLKLTTDPQLINCEDCLKKMGENYSKCNCYAITPKEGKQYNSFLEFNRAVARGEVEWKCADCGADIDQERFKDADN